jgi:hypothetical protein
MSNLRKYFALAGTGQHTTHNDAESGNKADRASPRAATDQCTGWVLGMRFMVNLSFSISIQRYLISVKSGHHKTHSNRLTYYVTV